MTQREFHIFKRNTEAIATNRGFYYQYLLTLKLWLDNFISNADIEIYCEREDDIFEIDKTSHKLTFHQIKCYAEGFGLNSPEIKSSLLNFYNLSHKYSGTYSGLFIFKTNADFKPRAGKSLSKWYNKQKKGDFSPTEFVDDTRNILIDHVDSNLNEYVKTETDNLKINIAKQKVIDFKKQIQFKTFENFLEKVRWEFSEEKNTTKSINNLLTDIKSIIKNDLKFDKNFSENHILGFLLNIVVEKSIINDENQRLLNNDLLQKIINTTDLNIKIRESFRPEIIQLMNNDFLIIEQLDKIYKIGTKTNKEVFQNAKKIDKLTELVKEVVIKKSSKEILIIDLTEQVKNWVLALGYTLEKNEVINENSSEFILNFNKIGGYDRIFVLCISETIELNDLNTLREKVNNFNCDNGWILTFKRISPNVRKKAGKEDYKGLSCFTLDELFDQSTNFTQYFDWLDKEIKSKKINTNYIPLKSKKDVFDKEKRIKVDTNEYLLEDYLDLWLEDPAKKHISLLGEFGTGKTWFTLHYAWKKMNDYIASKNKVGVRPRIPIFISLRDFTKINSIESVFSEFFYKKHNRPIPSYSAFIELNRKGKLLLIFDGFDEMADRVDKQKMINNFWEIARAITDNSKVILTCRNEHFPEATAGRELLNPELFVSTQHLETPQFEVLELLKFNDAQIKQFLSFHTDIKTIDKIFKNENILDLIRRPLMTELVLDAINDIEKGKPIDESRIYLYAINSKLTNDKIANRTFTSISDKIFFMCELSWEMLSTDNMSINYRLFPDRIRDLFSQNVKEQKDIDHWQYDMMGQTMLIRNDDGDYKPAHRSFLEFFVAYKFAAELGLLDDDFTELSRHKNISEIAKNYEWKQYFQNSTKLNLLNFQQLSIKEILNTFGKQILSKAVVELLLNMISINKIEKQNILLKLLEDTRNKNEDEVNNIASNVITILISYKHDYFKHKDLSNLYLKNFTVYTKSIDKKQRTPDDAFANFEGTNFSNSNLVNADFGNTFPLTTGKILNFENTKFNNTNLEKFHFNDIQIDSLDINEKYNVIAIGSLVGSIVLLNLTNFEVINRIYTVGSNLKFSLNKELLFSSSLWYLQILQAKNLEKISQIQASKSKNILGELHLTSNNDKIITNTDKEINIIDVNSLKIIRSLPIEDNVWYISLSQDDKYLAINSHNKSEIWDLQNEMKVFSFDINKKDSINRTKIKFSYHANTLVLIEKNKITFFDFTLKRIIWEIPLDNVFDIQFCNNGNQFIVLNKEFFIIYDNIKREIIKKIEFKNLLEKNEFHRDFEIRSFKIDENAENIYFISWRFVYCLNIEKEQITNKYKHMWSFKNADFSGATNLEKENAIQLQKNGAIINIFDYE